MGAVRLGYPLRAVDASHRELDERTRAVLRQIIASYIATGEPVGSAAIARRPDVDASPATIRSVMADLEQLGYLEKPHTSAGRVPTDKGYRFFIESVVRSGHAAPRAREREQIDRLAQRDLEGPPLLDQLLGDTTRLLHGLSHHVGLVVAPRPEAEVLRRLEFVRLREGRVLAVAVTRAGRVLNKLLSLEFSVSQADLDAMSNELNERLHDLPLPQAREKLAAELAEERSSLDAARSRTLQLAQAALAPPADGESVVKLDGQSSLLEDPAFQDPSRLRAVFRALEEKSRLLTLLDKAAAAGEVSIFIGAESGIADLRDTAVIAMPYGPDGEVVGTLGVIGPARMDYARVVPVVEYTARAVSRALGDLHGQS